MRDIRSASTAVALGLAMALTPAAAADWPQFRGPGRDGISAETGLASDWGEQGPPVLWRTVLGEGYSGMSVADGRLVTMAGRGADELVLAFDADSGEELWRYRIGDKWRDGQGNGPRSTPTIRGNVVYAVGAHGTLAALSASDGKELWAHDLEKEYRARIPRWGMSSSPLIEGDLLLVEVGGKDALIVAFDAASGKEAWRAGDGKAGYAAPLAVTAGGTSQVLFFTGDGLVSVSPADGKILWERAWKTSWDVNAAMPVLVPPDRVFVSSGYDVGAALFRLRADGVEELWRSRGMKNQFSSSLLHDGHLYGFDNKILKCIDAGSGELRWQARDFGHGSLIYADSHLIVMGERGTLALVEASPAGYREQARLQVFDGKTWTLPTLAGGILYLRDEKELVALDVRGPGKER